MRWVKVYGMFLSMALLAPACGAMPEGGVEQGGGAAGVTGPAFYVDGTLYRTVGTPRDLPTRAPEHSFDAIYEVSGYQMYNVAEAAPGEVGFNGGRWMVHDIAFDDYAAALAAHDTNGSGDFDSNEEIEAALDAGDAEDLGILRVFECPVIRLP